MVTPLTEAEAARIVEAEKLIATDIDWTISNGSFAKFKVDVDSKENWNLTIYGTAGLLVPKQSFSLVKDATLHVRRLCVNNRHANKKPDDNRLLMTTHLHVWKDGCRDRFAVETGSLAGSDPGLAFSEFCDLVGVQFSGTLGALPAITSPLSL